jgi:Ca-activated chloride channel family protein
VIFLPAILLLLQAIISVKTELVVVPAVVTDARGQHVSGLSQENFRVYEDGRPQDIGVFQRGEASVTLGLIVDRSRSMRPKTALLLAAVSAVLHSSRPGDELFAVDFNDRVLPAASGSPPFTDDVKVLETALTAVQAEGRTALYDGVAEGLMHLQLGHAGRQALIVVSDGGDNASQHTYTQILALARRSEAVIYAIGLLGMSPDEEDEDAGLLKRLCKETGGVAYFPKTAGEIAAVSTHIANDLREQYTLGFTPAERTDKRAFRTIKVTAIAAGQGGLHVRTRAGYIAAGDAGVKGKP